MSNPNLKPHLFHIVSSENMFSIDHPTLCKEVHPTHFRYFYTSYDSCVLYVCDDTFENGIDSMCVNCMKEFDELKRIAQSNAIIEQLRSEI